MRVTPVAPVATACVYAFRSLAEATSGSWWHRGRVLGIAAALVAIAACGVSGQTPPAPVDGRVPPQADAPSPADADLATSWCDDPSRNAFLNVHAHAGRSFPGFDTLVEFEARVAAYTQELAEHGGSGVLFMRPQQLIWWAEDPDGVFADARQRIIPVAMVRPWVVNDTAPGPEGYVEGTVRYGTAGGGDPIELVERAAGLGARAIKLNLRPTGTPNPNDLVGTCACADDTSPPPCPQPRTALPTDSRRHDCVRYDDAAVPIAPRTADDTQLDATMFDYFLAAAQHGLNVIVHGDETSGATASSGPFMSADILAGIVTTLRGPPHNFTDFQIIMGHGPQAGASLSPAQLGVVIGTEGLLWETSAGTPNFLALDYNEGGCDQGTPCDQVFAEMAAWLAADAYADPASGILDHYVHGDDLPDPLGNVALVGKAYALERDYLLARIPGLDPIETFCHRAARFLGLGQ